MSAEQLADRLAVQDVMIKYATSCDRRDMAEYGSCFTEDALITGFGGTGGDIKGRQAWCDYVAKALTRFSGTQHFIGNQRVWLSGATAKLTSSVQATHFLADRPGTTLTLFATYHDDLIKRDGVWEITNHRLEPISTQIVVADS
ncbi:MAG: nuclear transport factor 2 family protein [Dehalococcoidia bacterium]